MTFRDVRTRLRAAFAQTREEKDTYRNGLTLFFGALLGVNLGLLDQLDTRSYVTIVAVLAGVVMSFQLIGRARSLRYELMTVAMFGGILAWVIWRRREFFGGVDPIAVERLLATLGVWLVALILTELLPMTKRIAMFPTRRRAESA